MINRETSRARALCTLFHRGLLVSLVFSAIGWLLPKGEGRSVVSSVGGGLTGALVGAVVGLALVWGISLWQWLFVDSG